ncbi:ABC transporter permease [Thermobifida halotolerans]|uniref:ABC transporter permease n=1 Tax=Thermobifida halotolerans TaxID=483545 RepID=A0AA97LW68_9ACTN|nr:ABC transporter permease [Thermobifida halotolerans]UOE19272.1 ABC transporter permease [Thermobifida halotolerans]
MSTSVMRELVLLQTREFVRDRKYFLFALIFPLGMMGMFLGLERIMPEAPGSGTDLRQMVVPMAVYLALTGVGCTATAAPLAAMRSRGTLRLLGTTPVGRTRLVLTHMPARLGLVLVQVALLLAIGVAIGAVKLSALPALFGVSLLGLLMFGALGYLLGGLLETPDAAANVSTLVQLAAFFLSGFVVPLDLLPDAVAKVLGHLPTAFFADLMAARLPGRDPVHPAWLSVLVVLATAAVCVLLAVRTFRWDQGESH